MDPPEIVDARGVMVYLGLGHPVTRAFLAAAVVGSVAYVAGMPRQAFDEETGAMKPWKPLSKSPEATNAHFLAVPLTAAALVYTFS